MFTLKYTFYTENKIILLDFFSRNSKFVFLLSSGNQYKKRKQIKMSYLLDVSYTTTLIEFIKPICYPGIFSKILTATISASILAFSFKRLHKIGFFCVKEEPKTKWKKVGRVDKLLFYPLKGAKGLEQNVSYFGFLGLGPFLSYYFAFLHRKRK